MQTLADLSKRLGSEDAARMALGNLNNLIALRSKDVCPPTWPVSRPWPGRKTSGPRRDKLNHIDHNGHVSPP